MSARAFLVLTVLVVGFHYTEAAKFYVVAAGHDTLKNAEPLEIGSTICPENYPDGFSIVCRVPGATETRFFIGHGPNAKLQGARIERSEPFTLAGNEHSVINAWKYYSYGYCRVMCVSEVDASLIAVSVSLHIGCAFRKHRPGSTDPPINTRIQTPSPKPQSTSSLKGTRSTSPTQHPSLKIRNDYCIKKLGVDFEEGQLPTGWTISGGAITYKENDHSAKVELVAKVMVSYSFKVPVRAHYGVALDMETTHATDHNDVYIQCDGGLTMRRFGKQFKTTQPVKVYHNENGRSTKTFHKHKDPHTLSTSIALEPGVTYRCRIAGRSTRTSVHALILFPCSGDECDSNSAHWHRYLGVCAL